MKTDTLSAALAAALFALAAAPASAGSWNPTSSDSKNNTAGGSYALAGSLTGSGSTGFGYGALNADTSGSYNTALGYIALGKTTTGGYNTAVGTQVMYNNTTGAYNVAAGYSALVYNTGGNNNVALGTSAMQNNTTGNNNVTVGHYAGLNNTSANYNTTVGYFAGYNQTTGGNNIALGYKAGYYQTTGSNNIYIGNTGTAAENTTIRVGDTATHTAAYMAGVKNASVSGGSAAAVYIDSTGKLGTLSSSQRFKEDIRSMDEASKGLLQLRPVTFRYKESEGGDKALEYGLIAEEVAKVYPDLVLRNDKGEIQGVQYHKLPPMLLNEMQSLARTVQAQAREIGELKRQLAQNQAQARQVEELARRVAHLEERPKTPGLVKASVIKPGL